MADRQIDTSDAATIIAGFFENEEEWVEMEGEEDNEQRIIALAEELNAINMNHAEETPPEIDQEAQNKLRKAIFAIRNDPNISNDEKAAKVQELMSSNWRELSKSQRSQSSSLTISLTSAEPTPEELRATYYDESNKVRGCMHYQRGAKLQANCCGRWFTCRYCHDSVSDHQIIRYDTKKMMCMYCQNIQTPNQICTKCQTTLARYYCDICKFWDDDSRKNVYHCASCGLCRVGTGLGKDFFHCDTCNCCLPLRLEKSHKCIERNLERDCPICGEYLFTSVLRSIYLPCGHTMHEACFREYSSNAYQCPICWKSLGNMKTYFERIDAILQTQKMPPEYEHFISIILCNDCEKRSNAKYHFVYHKCGHCGGYNTKVLETMEQPPVEEEELDEDEYESEGDNFKSNNNNNLLEQHRDLGRVGGGGETSSTNQVSMTSVGTSITEDYTSNSIATQTFNNFSTT
ncbi:7423_t:CDS:2, partial [Ambispora gerdemannii]